MTVPHSVVVDNHESVASPGHARWSHCGLPVGSLDAQQFANMRRVVERFRAATV